MAVSCAVRLTIDASSDAIWRLLTDAESCPRRNPTGVSLRGRIARGAFAQFADRLKAAAEAHAS